MPSTKTSKPKPKRDSVKSLRNTIKEINMDLESCKEQLDKKSDKNIRLLAEFDNYKRRNQEERTNLVKYAGKDLAHSILPILDDLNRTLKSSKEDKSQNILDGVKLIVLKLDKILEGFEIIPFESVGKSFDPDFHEALMSEKSDEDENMIIKEFEKGYMYGDKILRHAKVVVSKN